MTRLHVPRPARLAGAAFVALMATACASVPDQPIASTPSIETGATFPAMPAGEAPDAAWWNGFEDRELKRLYTEGEQAYAGAPPIGLLNNLLFYVARATAGGGGVGTEGG